MWTFEWWPHALLNGLNPFVSDIIWTPEGASLLQGGVAIPAMAIPLAPVTLAAGPVVAYNVASVLMPRACGLVCVSPVPRPHRRRRPIVDRRVRLRLRQVLPAHLLGHLNLTSVFLVPAAVHLVLLRLDEAISRLRFLVLMAIVFAVKLLLSAEILLMGLGVGALALLLAYAVGDGERRRRVGGSCRSPSRPAAPR
jgi:hypothetical protein